LQEFASPQTGGEELQPHNTSIGKGQTIKSTAELYLVICNVCFKGSPPPPPPPPSSDRLVQNCLTLSHWFSLGPEKYCWHFSSITSNEQYLRIIHNYRQLIVCNYGTLIQPSSAAERVFSLLANSFKSCQQSALVDYI